MAKIYFRRYKARIDKGEITAEQAIELAKTEVLPVWRNEVIVLLRDLIK